MRKVRNFASLIGAMMALGAIFATGASGATLNAYVDVDPDPNNLYQCYSYGFEADRPGETQISPSDVGPLDCGIGYEVLEFKDDFVVDFQEDGTGSVSPPSSGSGSFTVSLFPAYNLCNITVHVPIPIEQQPGGILGESWLGSIEVDDGVGDVVDAGSSLFCPPQPYDLKVGFFVND